MLIALCTALPLLSAGQFTYINETIGVTGDTSSEGATNIEYFDGGYYTWGGGVFDGQLREILSRLSPEGNVEDSVFLTFPNSYLYSGLTNSFQRIPGEDAFLVSTGIETAEGLRGFLMKVDSDLDTLWTNYLDIFPGQTYVTTHAHDGDGFVLAGEYQVGGVGSGTFISKVDAEGNYLWHEMLHEPEEGSFRNQTISVVPEGYVVSGSEGVGLDTEGQVEIYLTAPDELITLTNGESAISRGIMNHHVRPDGQILVIQPIRVSDYPGSSNPSFAYTKSTIFNLNIQELSLEPIVEYSNEDNWITGGAFKTIESSQDGIVQLGRTFIEVDDTLRYVSFIMKWTEDYEVDWYTELSYDQCAGCTNELFDIEQAPDGGYVMVGKFNQGAADPYDKTWLVKVDACGELEYSGCAPVGLADFGALVDSQSLRVSPNPARTQVELELSSRQDPDRWVSVALIDLQGRTVRRLSAAELPAIGTERLMLDVSTEAAGLYSVVVGTEGGGLYVSKLVVE